MLIYKTNCTYLGINEDLNMSEYMWSKGLHYRKPILFNSNTVKLFVYQ